jgi:hypothetical protein
LCVLAERKNSDVYGWFSFLLSIQISWLEHLYNPSLFFNRSMEEEMPCWVWHCHSVCGPNKGQWPISDKCSAED